MGEKLKKYRNYKNRKRLDKTLCREFSGVNYWVYSNNREEIELKRSLEREADRLLGRYKDGSVLKKGDKRKEDKRLEKLRSKGKI